MVVRIVSGIFLFLLGGLWIGQGFGLVKGSFMTGQPQYAILGTILVLVAFGLFGWAFRIHRNNTRHNR